MYKKKYIKYKTKYLELKNQLDSGANIIQEGGTIIPNFFNYFFPKEVAKKAAADKAAADKAAADKATAEKAAAEKVAIENAVAENAAAEKAAAEKAAALKMFLDNYPNKVAHVNKFLKDVASVTVSMSIIFGETYKNKETAIAKENAEVALKELTHFLDVLKKKNDTETENSLLKVNAAFADALEAHIFMIRFKDNQKLKWANENSDRLLEYVENIHNMTNTEFMSNDGSKLRDYILKFIKRIAFYWLYEQFIKKAIVSQNDVEDAIIYDMDEHKNPDPYSFEDINKIVDERFNYKGQLEIELYNRIEEGVNDIFKMAIPAFEWEYNIASLGRDENNPEFMQIIRIAYRWLERKREKYPLFGTPPTETELKKAFDKDISMFNNMKKQSELKQINRYVKKEYERQRIEDHDAERSDMIEAERAKIRRRLNPEIVSPRSATDALNKQLKARDDASRREQRMRSAVYNVKITKIVGNKRGILLKCPITKNLFIDPVIAKDGIVYEDPAIKSHFRLNSNKSPKTKQIIETTVEPVLLIKSIISIMKEAAIIDKSDGDINRKTIDNLNNTLSCPISMELFVNPVLAKDGNVYERSSIEQIIELRKPRPWKSPMINKPINDNTLLPIQLITDIIKAMTYDGIIPRPNAVSAG